MALPLRYLCAGFGDLIGADTLARIVPLFSGVRRDVTAARAQELLGELRPYPLRVLADVNSGQMPLDVLQTVDEARAVAQVLVDLDFPAMALGIGNEPNFATDYWKRAPARFGDCVALCRDVVRAVAGDRVEVVLGGVGGNLDVEPLDYLQAALLSVPADVIVGVHRYCTTTPPTPLDDAFRRLHAIAHGRRLWHTEGGWHTYPSRRGWHSVQFTDDNVAAFVRQDVQMFAGHVEVYTHFQAHDGPPGTEDYEAYFGAWTWDWTPKPAVQVFADFAAQEPVR